MPYYKDQRIVAEDAASLGVVSAAFGHAPDHQYCNCQLKLQNGETVDGNVVLLDYVHREGTPQESTIKGVLTAGEVAAVDAAINKVAIEVLKQHGLKWVAELPQEVALPE